MPNEAGDLQREMVFQSLSRMIYRDERGRTNWRIEEPGFTEETCGKAIWGISCCDEKTLRRKEEPKNRTMQVQGGL